MSFLIIQQAIIDRSSLLQELVVRLAEAAVELVDNRASVEDYLTYFGRCFIRAGSAFGYRKMVRVRMTVSCIDPPFQTSHLILCSQACGRYFCELLSGIDNIHLHMRYTYPKMVNPFIFVIQEDDNGVIINYRTTRIGFCPFLFGWLI